MSARLNSDLGFLDRHQIPVVPDVSELHVAVPNPIIAVHGTMASAVPLADTLRAHNNARSVYRFEHDTWQEIVMNADALATVITRLGLKEVTFVAHSRGGLVVHAALDLLALQEWPITAHVVTLGAPYAGTDLVEVAAGGLKILGWTLGALKGTALPAVSAVTRLFCFVLPSRLPVGISGMSARPGATISHRYCQSKDVIAIGGDASMTDQAKRYAPASRVVAAVALAALEEPNDFVVPLASSHALVPLDRRLTVRTDHSGYLLDSQVKDLLSDMSSSQLDRWTATDPVPTT